jgi:hypothetical protein
MSPFPAQMRDRWKNRIEPRPGHGMIYWHMLMREYPAVRGIVAAVQERLASFNGFHMTPHEWLHMTTLIVVQPMRFHLGR